MDQHVYGPFGRDVWDELDISRKKKHEQLRQMPNAVAKQAILTSPQGVNQPQKGYPHEKATRVCQNKSRAQATRRFRNPSTPSASCSTWPTASSLQSGTWSLGPGNDREESAGGCPWVWWGFLTFGGEQPDRSFLKKKKMGSTLPLPY